MYLVYLRTSNAWWLMFGDSFCPLHADDESSVTSHWRTVSEFQEWVSANKPSTTLTLTPSGNGRYLVTLN